MSSGNLRPAAAVVVSVLVTSAGIWYIHKTQTWEREVQPVAPCSDPMHPDMAPLRLRQLLQT